MNDVCFLIFFIEVIYILYIYVVIGVFGEYFVVVVLKMDVDIIFIDNVVIGVVLVLFKV